MNSPDNNDEDPNNKHNKFSLNDNSTVFIDLPPNLTIVN